MIVRSACIRSHSSRWCDCREFVREPEALFWTFLFPVVLTLALGLAFRSRPEPVLKIAATSRVAAALRDEPGLEVIVLSAGGCA